MGPVSPQPRKSISSDPLATRPASRSVSRSATKAPARPTSALKSSSRPAAVASQKSALNPSKKPESSSKAPLKTASPASASDALALKAAAALSGANLKKSSDAPDGNNYSLGGKSPFLPSYNIEKRPLGDKVKEKKVEEIPKKNVYKREEPSKPSKKTPTVVIDEPKKSSGLSTVIIIILTIILGAAAGAGIYFLLPK